MHCINNSKKIILVAIIFAITIIGLGLYLESPKKTEAPTVFSDYKNTAYVINGEKIQLKNGYAEVESTGSASKTTVRYFGDELKTELNNDGREDVVFLLTQNTGGSGDFFYVVAALNTPQGYIGSDGYYLGDRIAPQNIVLSKNPNQKQVIVVNYADRSPGQPMTAQPSVGKSVYLKLDPETMQWAIVLPNFEGESASGIQNITSLP